MRAIVIGNATIDETFVVPTLPQAGETVLADARGCDIGGKGANQAVLLARAGLEVLLVVRIGRDPAGERIRTRLAAENLASGLIEGPEPTDRSLVLLDSSGENSIVSTRAAAQAMTAQEAVAALADTAPPALVLLQGNLALESTTAALETARARGLVTVFNAAPVKEGVARLWHLVSLAVVNEREAAQLTGSEGEAAAQRIVAAGADAAVVTLGEQGAVFVDRAGALRSPARAAQCIDSTGAGDTFTAVLAAARFARGLGWPAALALAAAAAAVTIGAPGAMASFPSRAVLDAILDQAVIRH